MPQPGLENSLLADWQRYAPAVGGSAMLTGSAVPALSVAGGFGLRFFSLILETATSNEINRELPSDQRATLISVSSILFSIAMIAAHSRSQLSV